MFYFRLLQGLGLVFAYMAVLTSPIVAFSYNGDFLPDLGQALAKMTVGNLGTIAPQGISQESRYVIIGCQGVDIKSFTGVFGYIDAASIILFTVYMVRFVFRTLPAEVTEQDQDTVSITDFAVEIDCLPTKIPDQATYEETLAKHIHDRLEVIRSRRKKGASDQVLPPVKVSEVCLVRDYSKRLGDIKARAEYVREVKICEYKDDAKKLAKMQAKVEKMSTKLAKHMRPELELPVLRAYCVLDCTQDVHALLVHYRFSTFALLRCCQRRENRFQGRAIRVTAAPEPTNIIPENQDVPAWERNVRRAVMFVLWLITLCISGGLIFYAGRTARDKAETSGSSLGSATCDGGTSRPQDAYTCNYMEAMLWNTTQAYFFNTDQLDCFCQTRGVEKIVSDAELRDNLCKDWLSEAALAVSWSAGASIITIIVNAVFRILVQWMVFSEKDISITASNASLMWKMFASQYMNTAIILFIINLHSSAISSFNGDYADFERGWYATVAGAMMTNMLLNTVTPSLIQLALDMVIRIQRCPICRKRKKHQAELLGIYENPPFIISARYAQLLTTVYCTLTYSPGLPLLNLFAAAFCFITYWADKWLLLRASKRTPIYDASLTKTASYIILLAIPLHCAVAIAMYSHACTFPSNPVGDFLDSLYGSAQSASGANTDATGSWIQRISLQSTWILFVLLVIAVVAIALRIVSFAFGATVGQALTACVYICCPSQASNQQVDLDVAASMSWEGKARDLVDTKAPPATYALDRHPDFEFLVKYLRSESDAEAGSPNGGQQQEATPVEAFQPGAENSLGSEAPAKVIDQAEENSLGSEAPAKVSDQAE
jgi:hypothetical protein